MRKIVVIEFLTLDGVMQSPGSAGEDTSGGFSRGGWIGRFSDSISAGIIRKQMKLPCDLLLGRKTFEIWAPYWPLHNELWPAVNTARKYVVSSTLTSHAWQPSTFINSDVAGEIRRIKEQDGPDLHVYGSANLFQTLIKHGLVDQLWLRIHPITLGIGKRLFVEGTMPADFTVSSSVVSSSGVIFVNYERGAGP
jgi:dihydrofolate reductase